jgi:hypothetical protein
MNFDNFLKVVKFFRNLFRCCMNYGRIVFNLPIIFGKLSTNLYFKEHYFVWPVKMF